MTETGRYVEIHPWLAGGGFLYDVEFMEPGAEGTEGDRQYATMAEAAAAAERWIRDGVFE